MTTARQVLMPEICKATSALGSFLIRNDCEESWFGLFTLTVKIASSQLFMHTTQNRGLHPLLILSLVFVILPCLSGFLIIYERINQAPLKY